MMSLDVSFTQKHRPAALFLQVLCDYSTGENRAKRSSWGAMVHHSSSVVSTQCTSDVSAWMTIRPGSVVTRSNPIRLRKTARASADRHIGGTPCGRGVKRPVPPAERLIRTMPSMRRCCVLSNAALQQSAQRNTVQWAVSPVTMADCPIIGRLPFRPLPITRSPV